MKRLFSALIVLSLIAFIASCGDNSGPRRFGGRAWSQALSPNDQALERAIIADVMGGIIAGMIQPAQMSLSGVPPYEPEEEEDEVDVDKVSISVPLEQSTFVTAGDTYVYPSESGQGALTVSVNGNVEEINVRSSTKRSLRFFPLEVTFSFDNFDYTNSCGLHSIIVGNVNCRLQGELNRISDVLVANGNCTTGSSGVGGTILYQVGEEEYHDLHVQSTVRANGPWSELTSYSLFGSYMLDRRSGTVDTVISQAPMVCEQ